MNSRLAPADWPWLAATAVCAAASLLFYFAPPAPYVDAVVVLGGVATYCLLVYLFAPAAYRSNWLRHTLAPLTGEGLNQHLLRHFWRQSEDLWSATANVSNRWLKLLYVYFASVGSQMIVPLFLGWLLFWVSGRSTLGSLGVVILFGVIFGAVLALAFATWDAYRTSHAKRTDA